MRSKRISSLFLCFAVAILSFVVLDFWSSRNAPLFKRFERQWHEDVTKLEKSAKLPKGWYDVAEIELIGGTPETKDWLRRIKVPLEPKKADGKHKLEILVVVWEEDGKRGVLVQYNLVDLETKNMIFELGRTLILSQPRPKNFWQAIKQEFTS